MERCDACIADVPLPSAPADVYVIHLAKEPCEACIQAVRDEGKVQAIVWPNGAIGLP